MLNVKIDDGNDNIYTSMFNITTILDEEFLILTLISKTQTIEYRVSTDDRFPEISLIKNFLQKQIALCNAENPFVIKEDAERYYIHINDYVEPLTACRLKKIIF